MNINLVIFVLYISTNDRVGHCMQLAPLLQKNASDTSQTPQKSTGSLDWITIAVCLLLFGGTIGAFVYLTLPSRDPVDLGVQTLEMQQANYCAGRCCDPLSKLPTVKLNVVQTAALVMEMVGNKDCVECPNYKNLKMSECTSTNQSMQ